MVTPFRRVGDHDSLTRELSVSGLSYIKILNDLPALIGKVSRKRAALESTFDEPCLR
jgi:hypothetical protein